jgi:crooked neck
LQARRQAATPVDHATHPESQWASLQSTRKCNCQILQIMESTRGPPRVKNKAAAAVQISAEQLLREAVDRQEVAQKEPTTRFADLEELHEFQARKRKGFEDYVRRNRVNINNFLRYAQWELEQKEYRRARSVFERALDVHPANVTVWLRYVDAELKSRNIMHARNLLDRAVTVLPRIDKLWFKYVQVEETLGNISGSRAVFDRYVESAQPPPHSHLAPPSTSNGPRWTCKVQCRIRVKQ